jgi:hypothetical protein
MLNRKRSTEALQVGRADGATAAATNYISSKKTDKMELRMTASRFAAATKDAAFAALFEVRREGGVGASNAAWLQLSVLRCLQVSAACVVHVAHRCCARDSSRLGARVGSVSLGR